MANLDSYDPNAPGVQNGNFAGLPFSFEDALVILHTAPWDMTVSYQDGTSYAPEFIREASTQIDLYSFDFPDAWKAGLHMLAMDKDLMELNTNMRPVAEEHIDALESGQSQHFQDVLEEMNAASRQANQTIEQQANEILAANKLPLLIGGDHSTPYGQVKALAESEEPFGILQIDAHADLRIAYEGFEFSHASIAHNWLQLSGVKSLVQVGVRDICQDEIDYINRDNRITMFSDQAMKRQLFQGETVHSLLDQIIEKLPQRLYISIDMDGLDPELCPETGTPVPGGLSFEMLTYLLTLIAQSGRTIIGADVCETGNAEYDANVASRVIYHLACAMIHTHNK